MIPALRRRLLAWYRREHRHLPWRAAPGELGDPYRVWVSEIMLQQTRVSAVVPYFERFLQRFPHARALAEAEEAEVLALWSGLGYYRRARQLHAAARIIRSRHGGAFPLERGAAEALPGIGAYTAAAILSMAGGLPLAAVDGNIARIASRLTGRELSPRTAQPLLDAWRAPRRAGDFNQALMDLGATLCLPRAPLCGRCPLSSLCCVRGDRLPRRHRRQPRQVELHYLLAQRGPRVFLRQRSLEEPQMPGLWELPPADAVPGPLLGSLRHAITTSSIRAHVHAGKPRGGGRWMNPQQAAAAPLTGLTRKILRRLLAWPL